MTALARKLERCSRVKESIAFYSHKMRAMQYCESRLEANAALLREFDSNVVAYLTQPQSFGYRIRGKQVRYTPDALVKLINGRFIYEEVKDADELRKPHIASKYSYLSTIFNNVIGHPLHLNTALSESECFTIPNLQQLYFYRCLPFALEPALEVANKSPSSTCIAELQSCCKDLSLAPDLGWQLAAHGYYSFSNDEVLSAKSKLEFIDAA
ncbi:TnsA endonuclease N-terminal domain-containing protein [Amphritea pacifica]|uniref:TnsA endonuclease N-terminal domain-containing protein n=1 Tax=Amphritea pacifica TaxID=2811233 RepID=A0ABS2WCE8_9GAMM|nr:TnsA endonuclease N-terminal domain-containing protein [Amphritea pacifica]MBN0989364.1 hypothetical protein [Amphritea pacifica]